MRILSLDPGVTTGYAFYETLSPIGVTAEGRIVPDPYVIDTYQVKDDVDATWVILNNARPDVVVYEKFTPPSAQRFRVELFPVQVIGVARLYCLDRMIPEYSHTASAAKGLWTDTKLKTTGLWKPGKEYEHAMDALRHLLYHLTVTKKDMTWINQTKK